jgi:V/A-type H+-transporting ATPase subunit I
MYSLSLLLFYTEKKRMLRGLQNLGVVDLNLVKTETERTRRAAQNLAELRKSLAQILRAKHGLPQGTVLPEVALPNESAAQLKLIRSLLQQKEQLENALREMAQEYARYEPWGEIPVGGIALLAQHGIGVHLFSGSEKFFDRYDFGEHCVEEISRGGNIVRFALLTLHADAPVIPFQKFAVPGSDLAAMRREREFLEKKLLDTVKRLAALAGSAHALMRSAAHLETQRSFETAKHSLEADTTGTIYRISGYFPAAQLVAIRKFLEERKLAYEIGEPAEPEKAPVLLHNGRLAKLFEPITGIFSLPDYRELDPTPLFAPFFTLFFGFCMGDVGYGLLLLVISTVLLLKKNLRKIGLLGVILSAATIGSGLLMNSFFGANLFVRDGQGLLATKSDPAFFAAYTVQGKTVFPAMTLSLLIGCLQIFAAFILQSVNEIIVLGWRLWCQSALDADDQRPGLHSRCTYKLHGPRFRPQLCYWADLGRSRTDLSSRAGGAGDSRSRVCIVFFLRQPRPQILYSPARCALGFLRFFDRAFGRFSLIHTPICSGARGGAFG